MRELEELFSVTRATIYRAIVRAGSRKTWQSPPSQAGPTIAAGDSTVTSTRFRAATRVFPAGYQGVVACSTASVSAAVRNAVRCWYAGSATIRLNADRSG